MLLLITIIFIKNIEAQSFYHKSKQLQIADFPDDPYVLKRLIDHHLFALTMTVMGDTLNIHQYDLLEKVHKNIHLNISKLNCNGVIDFYVEDSMVYLLSDNGSRVMALNHRSELILDQKIKNPHSNLFQYTALHAYKGELYLLYTIDMSSKTRDPRNLFVDRLNQETQKPETVFATQLNANFFLISNYQNWAFYNDHFYYSDIVTGAVYGVDLKHPDTIENVLLANSKIKELESQRIAAWEKNYKKNGTSALLDSIRNQYSNGYSCTWLCVGDGLVTALDKLPGDSCNAVFRTFDLNTKQTYRFELKDETGKCLCKPYLGLLYLNTNQVFQFFNFYDPKRGQTFQYYVYTKVK